LWASPQELRRITRSIPQSQRGAYCRALLARLELANPDQRLPEVRPWRGGRDQRVRMINSLTLLGDRRAAVLLTRLCDDENAEVRQAAIAALGGLGDPDSIPALTGILTEPRRSTQDRLIAVESLAVIGSERAVPGIAETLRREASVSDLLRRKLIHALGVIGGEAAVGLLIEVLVDWREVTARIEAALALGRAGQLRGLLFLAGSLDDPSPAVRRACILGVACFEGEIARAALNYALADADERVRAAARDSLQSLRR
jgi:HEAT repeat protein